jgi:serine/threonine protein kinase
VTLDSGMKIGPYAILGQLGAGGQGEVYKARDTRLNRFVAIRVLPERLSQNPALKARFEREAQTLAKLSHSHICPVFDIGQQDGTDYLVMEFLEGETLARRLDKRALPLDDPLKIAIEIADAVFGSPVQSSRTRVATFILGTSMALIAIFRSPQILTLPLSVQARDSFDRDCLSRRVSTHWQYVFRPTRAIRSAYRLGIEPPAEYARACS